MSNTTFITTHIQLALNRFLFQYKNKPKIEGTVSAFVKQVQDLEDALGPLVLERSVNTATGIQLDKVGAIVGVARITGQSDEEYRIAVKNKVIQNLNQGTPEEFIAAAKFFLLANAILFLEVYPAEVDIFTEVPLDPDSRVRIRALLENFLPAGVSLGSFGKHYEADGFIFNGGKGFGDVNDVTIGGLLADVFPDTPDLPYYVLLTDQLDRFLTDQNDNLLAG